MQKERLSAAHVLIELGADVFHRDTSGQTALHMICAVSPGGTSKEEKYNMCKLLFEKGAAVDCNTHNTLGHTPLDCALPRRSLKIINLLIDHAAYFTEQDFASGSALHRVALNRHVDVIDCIANQGFDMEATTWNGLSPLHVAAQNKNAAGCKYFLERGALVNKKNQPA